MSLGNLINLKSKLVSINPVTALILEDSSFVKYWIFIDSNGVLQTRSGAVGTALNLKVTGGSISEAALKISTNGELQVDNAPSGGETLNNNLRIRSLLGGKIFKIDVDSSNQITTEEV